MGKILRNGDSPFVLNRGLKKIAYSDRNLYIGSVAKVVTLITAMSLVPVSQRCT